MWRTFKDLSEEEIIEIAKQCEKMHFISVASERHLDPHTVAMCITQVKITKLNNENTRRA